jgi:prevent-host-death family protein
MVSKVRNDEVRIYKVRDLNHDTARVLKEVNDSGRPAVITKHGRFVAMLTPLEGRNVEGLLLDAVLRAEQADGVEPEGAQSTMSTAELARELDITLPRQL